MVDDEEAAAAAKLPFEIDSSVKTEREQASTVDSWSSFILDWICTNIIGFLTVSYWRGTWTLIDIFTCGQSTAARVVEGEVFCTGLDADDRFRNAWFSYMAGNILFLAGMLGVATWKMRSRRVARLSLLIATRRTLVIYVLGAATVNIWRGIWYVLDEWIVSTVLGNSISALAGAVGVMLLCAGASLLAPPAIFLMDGPSRAPPPIVVTLLTSYRSLVVPCSVDNENNGATDPCWYSFVDMVLSFAFLPWLVVAFWRGTWNLMDSLLWGFGDRPSLYYSLGYSCALAFICLTATSEDIVQYVPTNAVKTSEVFSRVRSLVMAIGAVNFWRAVWYIWDEFLGSAIVSHCVGVFGLLFLGCLSCITAPPATLGVDAIAYPGCPEEPLFHNIPVPAEALHILGVGRQPTQEPSASTQDPASSFSFISQSAAHVDRTPREQVSNALKARNAIKRQKSQFYRSR